MPRLQSPLRERKLWFINTEAALSGMDSLFSFDAARRYFWCLNQGDGIYVKNMETSYIKKSSFWSSFVKERNISFYSSLNEIQSSPLNYGAMEFYWGDREVLEISRQLGIPFLKETSSEEEFIMSSKTLFYNSKKNLKVLDKEMNFPISCVPFSESKIKDPQALYIFKLSISGGGLGHQVGSYKQLSHLANGRNENDYIIEDFLNLKDVLGSLVRISPNHSLFDGIDLQVINSNSWGGAIVHKSGDIKKIKPEYDKFSLKIKETSLLLAERIRREGGRGYLNLDFGIDVNDNIFLLEANFRMNGFQLMQDILRAREETQQIHYLNSWIPFSAFSQKKEHMIIDEKIGFGRQYAIFQ